MAQPFSNLQPLSTACDYHLPCTIETVAWGYLCAAREPQLTIESGATISVDTVSMPLNGNLERGLPTTAEGCLPCEPHTPPEILDIHKNVQKGEGPHVLTGPIAVRGAEAGDVLSISILEVALRSNWAWTFSKPFGGALGSAMPLHIRHTKLEPASGRQRGVGRPWWGGQLDLAPFFGILGTAPAAELGRQGSIPPRNEYGGNLDCKELTAGSTVYLPVNVPNALLYVGDGHAAQGDGECCGTALETSLTGAFRLEVIKQGEPPSSTQAGTSAGGKRLGVRAPLKQPRAETDSCLISLACAVGSDEASRLAIEDMLDWLADLRPGLERRDAYLMLSVAADVRITQVRGPVGRTAGPLSRHGLVLLTDSIRPLRFCLFAQLVNGVSRGCHVIIEKKVLPPATAPSVQ
jgi:acetamidase/formamidase